MAWNSGKPAASTLVSSAEVRANFQALERSMLGRNWAGDPAQLCWHAGDAAAPAFYELSGTGAAVARTGVGLADTNTYGLGYAAKVTFGTAAALYRQRLLRNTRFPTWLRGKDFSLGWAVKTSSGSQARISLFDGVSRSFSSYHTGGNAWEWLTVTRTIDAAATGLHAEANVEASGSAYFEGCCPMLGPVAPQYFFPTESHVGVVAGARSGSISATGVLIMFPWNTPAVVQSVYARLLTATSSGTLTCDANHWDGAAFQSMFTNRPAIPAAGANGYAVPDATYRYRCFGFTVGTTIVDSLISLDIDGVATGGSDLFVFARALQWIRPQQEWLDPGE